MNEKKREERSKSKIGGWRNGNAKGKKRDTRGVKIIRRKGWNIAKKGWSIAARQERRGHEVTVI